MEYNYGQDYSGSEQGSGGGSDIETTSPVWISVLQMIFCGFGVVGNVIVIFVILALKEYKKTVTNWYVLQLAIADLIFLCTLPIKIKEKHDGKWPGSVGLCKLNEALIFLNYNSSIIFLTVMSIDRYLIVCRNASALSQTLRKRSAAYIATAIVWVLSLIFCTPVFMYSTVTNCKCRYVFENRKTPEEECKVLHVQMQMEKEACLSMLKEMSQIPDNCEDTGSDYDDFLKFTSSVENPQGNSSVTNLGSGNGTFSGDTDDYPVGFNLNMSDSALYPSFGNSDDANETFDSVAPSFNDSQGGFDDGGPPEPSVGLPRECTYEEESDVWFAFIYFNVFALFVVPFVVMLICYSLIVKRMIQSGSRKTSLSLNTGERPKKEKRKATKSERAYARATRLCVAYVLLFAICWLPFHSVHLAMVSGIHQTREFCISLSAFVFILVVANSAINPCLYSIVGKKFLGRLRNAFSSLQGKITSRVDSFSSTSGFAVRYRGGKRNGFRSNSNSATATTKIYKGKSDVESSDHSSGDGIRHSGSG